MLSWIGSVITSIGDNISTKPNYINNLFDSKFAQIIIAIVAIKLTIDVAQITIRYIKVKK